MATMEKPKAKTKKAKIKKTPEVLSTQHADQMEASSEGLLTPSAAIADNKSAVASAPEQNVQATVDFDQFTAATSKDIVSHECSIASDSRTLSELEEQRNLDTDSPGQRSLHDELVQAAANFSDAATQDTTTTNAATATTTINAATATTTINAATATAPTTTNAATAAATLTATAPPVAAVSASIALNTAAPLIQYPNLTPLQHVESKSKIIYQQQKTISPGLRFADSQLAPFTDEQLQQIYHCAELDLVKQFELEFLMNSLLETYENDVLYLALQEYYNLQSKLTMNVYDVKKSRLDVLQAQESIWEEVPVQKTFADRCGDRVEVKETVTYNIAQVNGKNLEDASAALSHLYDLVCHTYTTNLITVKITKVRIDQMIDSIISMTIPIALPQQSRVVLHDALNALVIPFVANLRRSISILFCFARKLSPSKSFDADLKAWLRKLIALHLLVATKEDHWFLLFNILRCPSGVGQWAAEFLQIPCTVEVNTPSGSRPSELPLNLHSAEISHCIATLQILLLPIKKRNEYLKAFTQEISDPAKEERWILVDSDGEDSHTPTGECVGLKESDLIALLNQIPFEQLFRSALNIEKFLNDYIITPELISTNQMLKAIAFFNKLIQIFGEGMLTYNTERYKQLAKRLGRLIRHTLQYTSDYFDIFMHNDISKDAKTCERISVELYALLFKACTYIYRGRNLATWQYFSSLPFGSLDMNILWQIFYYLNVGFPSEVPALNEDYVELLNASDFWAKFNVANADSSPEDMYYLLQAFFEMANERDKDKDWDLIKTICLHTFHIGFINTHTREICYKTARDMLVNLTLAYEDLMSCLLLQLKVRFSEIENSAYLIKSLPLESWKPSMDSFEILSNWLLHFDYKSQENMVARIVISHLNWGFDCDGRLFLPHNIHVRMACLVTEALTKHAPEVVGLSGISESVRQVSSLIDFTQSTKEQFTTWCWTMVSVLRLHLMDQSVESIKRTIRNPTEPLMFVPDLERIDLIFQGVTENRPLALYVAILVSLHGHSIPLICQKGFELMKLLLTDYRHAAVIRCLELIVPLFLETPETLANCENFHIILNALLNADRTYLKMAKDMIYPNSVGPVLELLDNMIHHQITTYTDYGLSSPLNLINVWLNCLTALPNWQNTNVVYLLDKVLRVAYQFPDARVQAVEYFQNYYKNCEDWKGVSKMSTLKTLFGSSQSRVPTLSPHHAWLALILLEIEFKQQDANFWPEFLRQLAAANGKTALETALKKTTSIQKLAAFPAQMLVLYKYANLVASMDISHPVFPIVNQKFFELYLSRVPLDCDEYSFGGVYGVSDKFYDYNVPLMKKLSTNLKAAEVYYSTEATKRAADESLSYFYRDCAKLVKSYELWLNETDINRHPRDDCNFPPQYNNEKLREILNGNTHHWTEYIFLPDIRKEQKYQGEQWARKCYRSKSIKHLRSPIQPKEKITSIERIETHLASYDKRLDAPNYVRPKMRIPNEITSHTLKELKEKIKVLNSTATKFHFESSELNSLNRNYIDIVLNLYKMVPYNVIKIKDCNSLLFNRKCTNPARITMTQERIRKDDEVERKVQKYRERHDKIIDSMIELNVEEFAQCIEELGGIMRILLTTQKHNVERTSLVTDCGIRFFYNIIDNMTDVTMKFQPTHDFYSQILNEMSIFIQDNQEKEGFVILELALKRPDLIKVLAGAFVPYRTRPEYFLKMYKFLVESHLKRCDTKILFVLLSKFDLVTWLDNMHPKLHEVNQLLQSVLRGLECWSQPDSSLLQDQFRRHLVHIFDHDFPQHYGEVMQMVLDRISDQKVMPEVLLDMLNSLLVRFSCNPVSLDTTNEDIVEVSMDFARRQNLFNLKAATDTVMLFARHFQKERLNHGLHGLYPKHKNYCKPLSMWFSCFGHVVVVAAICTYQELLADQISEVIFGSIIEMYSPWLVAYTEQTLQQSSANWIRQFTEKDKVLLPWSEKHAATSKTMIKPFINTLLFVLDNLPVSHIMLAHTYGWYIHHFTLLKLECYIYEPIHEGMVLLPWERFKPQPNYIDMLYDSLQKFVPPAHAMLGHIFLRINWISWFSETQPHIASNQQTHVTSRLFTVFIKIAFEPNIHIHINTSKILEDAINYPWYMVEYAELENLCKWFMSVVDAAIILKIPSESNYADRAVLDLLRLSCGMMPENTPFWEAIMQPMYNGTAKRILYTRTFMHLLRLCASKNQKLLATKNGINAFSAAFANLLDTMNNALIATAVTKTQEEQRREALNLIIEIVVPMQTQSEETSNLQIDTMIQWQQQCIAGNFLVCSTLDAIGHMKAFIGGVYPLLESTIVNYFRTSPDTKDWHTPTWPALLRILQPTLNKLELMPIIRGPYFFTLHIFFLYKMEKIENIGDRITFLQDLCQLTENLKTSPHTEPRLALVWGAIISHGSKILCETANVRKALFMLGHHLHVISTQAEGWSDGLLGAIGLKTDVITNKRKALTRCLSCVVFSLFPRNSSSGSYPNQEFENSLHELTVLLANKKFVDIKPSIVRAIGIVKDQSTPIFRDVPHLVCRLIALFYENTFLTTIPEIWDFEFRLN